MHHGHADGSAWESHQRARESSSCAMRSAAQRVIVGSNCRSNAGRGTQSNVICVVRWGVSTEAESGTTLACVPA